MKNYYEAHETAYKHIKEKGLVGWGNVKTLEDLEDDETKAYLTSMISRFLNSATDKRALDLGCGTGPSAFTMAKMGFSVTGVDISETAIAMAQELATLQKLSVQFKKWDILNLESLGEKFDLIYDSHCLHCIVFDEDRRRVLEGIKNSMTDQGIFVLNTGILLEGMDPASGYDTLRFDQNYILWHKTSPTTSFTRGVMEVDGQHWCAQRRFYPANKIKEELQQAGFEILQEMIYGSDSKVHGNIRLVCR